MLIHADVTLAHCTYFPTSKGILSATANLSGLAWGLSSTARFRATCTLVKDVISCQESSSENHSTMFLGLRLPAIDVHTPHTRLPMPLNMINSAPLIYVTAPLMCVTAPLCCDVAAASITLLSSPEAYERPHVAPLSFVEGPCRLQAVSQNKFARSAYTALTRTGGSHAICHNNIM